MAYVPGAEFEHDVFISYSHADNKTGWVANFERAFSDRLQELLGEEPLVWRDKRNLSGEHDFTDEIKRRLERSAVLIAVVSNPYFNSPFCRLERDHFIDHAHGGVRVGTRHKILRAVKLPADGNLHETVPDGASGFDFYRDQTDQGAIELVPAENDFRLAIDRLAKGAKNVLREMRNLATPIYVAEPPPDEVSAVWKRLLSELKSRGFHTLPTFRPDRHAQEAILAEAMKPAASTVHLLGSNRFDPAEKQIRIAEQLRLPTIVWMPPDADPDLLQLEYAARLGGFVRIPDFQLADHVASRTTRKPAAAPERPAGPSRIYLICDRSDEIDNAAAVKLGLDIQQAEQLKVFLNETDRDAAILDERHRGRLAECDAVLLFWGRAPEPWFQEYLRDLETAERTLRAGRPFLSKAVYLAEPREISTGVPTFSAGQSLEPFLQPLRSRDGVQKGANA